MNTNKDWLITTKLDVSKYKDLILDTTKEIENNLKNKSTSGDLSEQYDLIHKYREEPFINLKNYIASHVKNALVDSNIILPTNILRLATSWVVVGKDYGYHTLHKHNVKVPQVAVVVYLEVPEDNIKRNSVDRDGNFYIVAIENNEIIYKLIEPEVNKMLIFPVWLWHGTYPQKKGRRISLNLDFSIE